jgi:phosphatidylglycerophosphatase A
MEGSRARPPALRVRYSRASSMARKTAEENRPAGPREGSPGVAAGGRASRIERWLALPLATGLGAGFSPIAPGTAGTIFPALPLAWLLQGIGLWAVLLSAGALFLAGWWAAGASERIFEHRDPQAVVIDEVVGFLLTVAGLPPRWQVLLSGFLIFRVVDVVKPWPAGLIDRRVPGGLGIMLDDVAAALYARAALALLFGG